VVSLRIRSLRRLLKIPNKGKKLLGENKSLKKKTTQQTGNGVVREPAPLICGIKYIDQVFNQDTLTRTQGENL
jgi:hypothetical protein